MVSPRKRAVLHAGLALLAIWAVALAAYFIVQNARMTAEKVRAYAASVDLSRLSAAERARALQRLAEMLNALSLEERQRAQLDRVWRKWFDAMTEQEKSAFLDATLPTGFKQMLDAFEKLPEDQRRRTIDNAMTRLRADQAQGQDGGPGGPALSPELQAKIRTIGLKTYFSQSSAETKAELAPLLEEIQRTMETGGRFRHR